MPAKKQSKLKKFINKIKKPKPKVAVLRLNGVIGSAGMMKKGISLDDLNEDIEKAFEVSGVKAVALQINSPGGSPVQSELIYKRIRELSDEKKVPVYSFVEDVAASGGYWLACTGDEIYASESSIVGSIGVISAGFGFVEAIKKLGVERRVYTQGENKSVLDPFQKEDPKDIDILMNLQKDVHESFKNLVRSRRDGKIQKTKEKQLFSGEFWNGVKGKELGLIDDIGDMHSVMKQKYGKKVKFEKVLKPKSWLAKKISGVSCSVTEDVSTVIAEKLMWSRFGQ